MLALTPQKFWCVIFFVYHCSLECHKKFFGEWGPTQETPRIVSKTHHFTNRNHDIWHYCTQIHFAVPPISFKQKAHISNPYRVFLPIHVPNYSCPFHQIWRKSLNTCTRPLCHERFLMLWWFSWLFSFLVLLVKIEFAVASQMLKFQTYANCLQILHGWKIS